MNGVLKALQISLRASRFSEDENPRALPRFFLDSLGFEE